MPEEKTNHTKMAPIIGVAVILSVWAIVIYLLWDVRHYVKLSTTMQRRAVLARGDNEVTEPFRDSPYQSFPGYRTPAQELKW